MRFSGFLKARTFILVNQWKPALNINQQEWGHSDEGRCSVGSYILLALLAHSQCHEENVFLYRC